MTLLLYTILVQIIRKFFRILHEYSYTLANIKLF